MTSQKLSASTTNRRLLTRKTRLHESRLEDCQIETELKEGEAIIQLERFGLTTNNITYAAFGDAMGYWQFFPTGQDEWGHMPVWGIGRVIASAAEGIQVGDQYFGYYPMATHLKVIADKISAGGFVEVSAHRKALPAAYNYYTNYAGKDATSPESDYRMLLRPLFLTSYMLADYLIDNAFFTAQQIVISSASSKTAFGSAFCLAGTSDARIIGLTSEKNQAFVQRLGCYKSVATYEELASIDAGIPTLYIDFSGDDALREHIHQHFGDNLVHDCYAGSASNLAFNTDSVGDADRKTYFFFAAPHYRKRVQELGGPAVLGAMDARQADFIQALSNPQAPWIRLCHTEGFEQAAQVVEQLCDNKVAPDEGHIVVLP